MVKSSVHVSIFIILQLEVIHVYLMLMETYPNCTNIALKIKYLITASFVYNNEYQAIKSTII
jgi:hypothetical protein